MMAAAISGPLLVSRVQNAGGGGGGEDVHGLGVGTVISPSADFVAAFRSIGGFRRQIYEG